jgi:hypothetical protein
MEIYPIEEKRLLLNEVKQCDSTFSFETRSEYMVDFMSLGKRGERNAQKRPCRT